MATGAFLGGAGSLPLSNKRKGGRKMARRHRGRHGRK